LNTMKDNFEILQPIFSLKNKINKNPLVAHPINHWAIENEERCHSFHSRSVGLRYHRRGGRSLEDNKWVEEEVEEVFAYVVEVNGGVRGEEAVDGGGRVGGASEAARLVDAQSGRVCVEDPR